jgi:hypothetical protein
MELSNTYLVGAHQVEMEDR